MTGLFDEPAFTKTPLVVVPKCGACGLYKECHSPKMPVAGGGRKGILVVGEAPGREEDERGLPFVGPSGGIFRDRLRAEGVDLDADCWVTNSVICRPPKNNLKAQPKAVEYCRPNVVNAIKTLKPERVLLFGSQAVKSVFGWLLREDPGGVERWAGFRVPCQDPNAWVTANYHPAALLYAREKGPGPLEAIFGMNLKESLRGRGRPWKELPDYEGRVTRILDDREAAEAVRSFVRAGRPTAFDFETDRIKPDHKDSLIRCCALSNGLGTIAFPWFGRAVPATAEFLASSVPKVGYNSKFEDRWCRRHLGVWPRNWVWDGMLAAHALDNRRGVCGLDFQAFVRLGQVPWDRHIRKYLKSKKEGGNEPNLVREADLHRLLTYCGTDALLELEVAKKQARQMGVSL